MFMRVMPWRVKLWCGFKITDLSYREHAVKKIVVTLGLQHFLKILFNVILQNIRNYLQFLRI